MENEKVKLRGIKEMLTRDQMKKIKAGSNDNCAKYGEPCGPGIPVDPPCCAGLQACANLEGHWQCTA